jgi:hypothetical protein
MNRYYQMTPKTCFLCKDYDGKRENGTPGEAAFVDCDHRISVGLLELQIMEAEELLRDLKKSKQYAKIIIEE